MELATFLIILVLIISTINLAISVRLTSRVKRLEHDQEAIPRRAAEIISSKFLKQIRITEREIPLQKIPEEKGHTQPSSEKFRIVSPANEEQPIQKNEIQHQVDEHTAPEKMKPSSVDTQTKKFNTYSVPSIRPDEESQVKDEYKWR